MIKFLLAFSFCLLCCIAGAQYTRSTTISVLTNGSSRGWQLGSITKTFGGCLDETLIITFSKDSTAEFKFCVNGSWQKKTITWSLEPTTVKNEWDIQFSESMKFERKDGTADFYKGRLKLTSKLVKHKGTKMILSVISYNDNLPEFTFKTFYSKN